MLTFIKHLHSQDKDTATLTLALTAEERLRSRHRFTTETGEPLFFRLPRGTVLHDGDFLVAETGEILKIEAKTEPVITVTAKNSLDLIRAAYHLGNRHVPLEVGVNYLRLSPDPVLENMLVGLGVDIQAEVLPFFPEAGAYSHH
jgi:urease accessory protein